MHVIETDEERRRFYEGIAEHPDFLLAAWTERIRCGERGPEIDGLATSSIEDFWLRRTLGISQSPVMLAWLADVLHDALEHRNASKLLADLGLLPNPNRRPSNPQKWIDVGYWLSCVNKRGYSDAEAVELAAQCFQKDTKTIERYRKQAADWASGMTAPDETWERYFLSSKPPRPLPRPKP